MLARLLADHRQIEVLADRLGAVLNLPAPDMESLKAARWELAKAMMQHIAYEDRHLYLPLEQDARADVVALAARFKDQLRCDQAAFEAHTARWTAAAMMGDWAGYRTASRRILQTLRARIQAEEAELFPLIGMVGMRPVAAGAQHNWARAAWDVRDTLDR